jgi:hypothetical protein
METLILVFDAPTAGPDAVSRLLSRIGAVQADDQQIVVERDDARAYLRPLDEPEELFFDWPRGLIPEHPHPFALDYSSAALAKLVVCALASERPFLVDTNFGAVLRSDEFCRQASDASWTWEVWE